MSLEVRVVQFLAPNSTLRGKLRGFSEKTRDFRRFCSKVEFYSAGLHMILVDSVSRAPSPIQGTSKRLAYSVRRQLVSRPVGNLCHVRGHTRAVAPLAGTPGGLQEHQSSRRETTLTGLLSVSQPLSSNLSRRETEPRVSGPVPGTWLTVHYISLPPFRTGEGGVG